MATDKKSVLVLGSDEQTLSGMCMVLANEGKYVAEKATEVADGMRKFQSMNPEVLMLDLGLAGLDPLKIVEQVRKGNPKHTIVILITELLPSAEVARYLSGGVDDFFYKPFGKAELLARVKSRMDLQSLFEKVNVTSRKIEELAVIDELTGLFNMRSFQRRMDQEISRAKRYKKPIALLLVDVDNFKKFSLEKGENLSNIALKEISKVIKDWTRGVDLSARFGPDAFLIVLPETTLGGAERVAERLRSYVEGLNLDNGQVTGKITCSIGVVSANCEKQNIEQDKFVAFTEQAVQEAKKAGKNYVQSKSYP